MTYLVQLFENSTSKDDRPQEPKPYNGVHPVYYAKQAFGTYLTCVPDSSFQTEEEYTAQHVASLLTRFWKIIPNTHWRPVLLPTPKEV